ncbi:HTH-type transcriptional regulator PuuR [anaerobic digester metagenome]
MDFQIGSRLRELRNKKKFSIAELSKISEVSTGLISQIERDLVVPSVVSLWRLANALETNINYFFEDKEKEDGILIRRGDHKIIVTHHNNSFYKLLSPTRPGHLLDMTEVRLEKGCTYEKETLCHEGEECGYVLKGTLTVHLNGNEHVLYEGDSIYFSSSLPHKYINNTDEECISIWAMTPPFF